MMENRISIRTKLGRISIFLLLQCDIVEALKDLRHFVNYNELLPKDSSHEMALRKQLKSRDSTGQSYCCRNNNLCHQIGYYDRIDSTSSVRNVRGGGGERRRSKLLTQKTQTSLPSASPRILQSIRVLYLTYYAALGALMPYLPVYFHSMGLAGSSIGILGAVKPLTTFLVAPFWGALSDQYGNHGSILKFTFVTSLLLQILVGWTKNFNFLIQTVFLAALFNAPVKSLIDTIVMSKLTSEQDKYQFGRLRLWGQIGFGLGSSFVGSLLSMFPADAKDNVIMSKNNSKNNNGHPIHSIPSITSASIIPTLEKFIHDIETGIEVACETDVCAETAAVSTAQARGVMFEMTQNLLEQRSPMTEPVFISNKRWYPSRIKGYQWSFLMHAILSIPTFFAILACCPEKEVAITTAEADLKTKTIAKMELNEKKKQSGIAQGIHLLFRNSDAMIFFFLVFVIGTSSGCIENFAYVRVREVGGSGNQMGMLRLVSSLAGAPMFWFSGPLTAFLGVDVVMVLSILAYVARFFNYAYMLHPYHALPAEALRGITFALFWSSGSTYAHKISPPGMSATMLMIMNAMYGGLGQSLGAIIGGAMQSKLGTVGTFIYSGLFDLCFVASLVGYLLSTKKRRFS